MLITLRIEKYGPNLDRDAEFKQKVNYASSRRLSHPIHLQEVLAFCQLLEAVLHGFQDGFAFPSKPQKANCKN